MANALSVSASILTVDTHRVAFCVTALCRDCWLQIPIVWSMTPALISIRLRFGTLLCGMRNQEDTAIWDPVAKIASVPLYRLVADRFRGGVADTKVFVYAAGGYYYPEKGLSA